MKIAVAGKGGVGKTTIATWLGDFLARSGHDVYLVDADTALSLGQASGLERESLPKPLVLRTDLVAERIGSGFMHLNPDVGDLSGDLAVELPVELADSGRDGAGRKRLLVMGTVTGAGGGCACGANSLLKALLAHLVLEAREWVVVDLEAGVEHLGRGTVAAVDGLVVVSEPSRRGLDTAAEIARLALGLGLKRQALVLNRHQERDELPDIAGLPPLAASIPVLPSLTARQLTSGSVLGLEERSSLVDPLCRKILAALR
ncbi:AAA family ATPase [Desulfonatronum lacustre]|uniref:ATP-binding protein n=1 Tax=Desulfonatronum lacustre TaxID=66849 RepID=UPI000490DDF2|nr:AAA family ATPase [Desulfonatronum lacustre]